MSGTGRSRLNQAGMVSFLVTLIMMAVITLIVVGFSQVTRRNAKEALDRQLSTQAFYAAESGVNVAKAAIASASPAVPLASKTTCPHDYQPDATKPAVAIKDISTSANVRYTCVLVDPNPDTLIYDKLKQGDSIVVPMNTSAAIDTLSFSWTSQTGLPAGSCTGQPRSYLPPATGWGCPFALLRVDLMQVPSPGATINNVSQLTSNTASLFLTPYGDNSSKLYDNATGGHGGGGASLTFGGATTVYYGAASGCKTSPATNCRVDARLASPQTTYYARITPLYHDVDELVISAKAGVSPVKFNGTQAIVDVTGQAQDELRRIQVRVGLQGGVDVPANAVASSSSICKNFTILPTANISDTTVCQ